MNGEVAFLNFVVDARRLLYKFYTSWISYRRFEMTFDVVYVVWSSRVIESEVHSWRRRRRRRRILVRDFTLSYASTYIVRASYILILLSNNPIHMLNFHVASQPADTHELRTTYTTLFSQQRELHSPLAIWVRDLSDKTYDTLSMCTKSCLSLC